jgi:ribonuclease Z
VSFSVTILGSGAAVPTSTRNPTSQLIECNGRNFLIDCGEGTQMQTRRYGVNLQRIERIFISHLHGDHYFGLVGLLSTMHMMGRKKSITIHGPMGLKAIIDIQLHAAGSRLAFDVNILEVDDESSGMLYEDDYVSVSYFPLAHKIPTSGFIIRQKVRERTLLIKKAQKGKVKVEYFHRLKKSEDVTDQKGNIIRFEDYTAPPPPPLSYAFCSDTKYHEPILDFIKDVNVLYHEATFTELLSDRAKATKHSTASQAATIALKAGVDKLLMGHLSARYNDGKQHELEAQPIFENSRFVEDGDIIKIED